MLKIKRISKSENIWCLAPKFPKLENFWCQAPKVLLLLSLVIPCFANAANQDIVQFDSGEHVFLGNTTKIYFPKDGKPQDILGSQADFRPWLKLDLQKPLTYGKLVAIPDLFASKNQISDGNDLSDRCKLFTENFNVFAQAPIKNLDAVYAVMDDESKMVQDAIDKHEDPSIEYKKIGRGFALRYFLAYPDTAKLFIYGWDHFGNNAWIAYQAGHSTAIATAVAAHKQQDLSLLALAYAEEGYADHFLTDRFASGHLRTPDKELTNVVAKETVPQALITYLALLMHDEDNVYGLKVKNFRGDSWIAFGDTRCLDANNAKSKALIDEAMQTSADEIKTAFLTGQELDSESYGAAKIIPDLTTLDDYLNYVDGKDKTIPLFVYDPKSNDVLRRKQINLLHPDKDHIDSSYMLHHGSLLGWHAFPTLLEIEFAYHPKMFANMSTNVADYTTSDGKLTDAGAKLLSYLLGDFEKIIFCVDLKTDQNLKKYLQCSKLIQN